MMLDARWRARRVVGFMFSTLVRAGTDRYPISFRYAKVLLDTD